MAINATAKYIDVVNLILPPYIVESQLNILTPVGTPMPIVVALKTRAGTVPRPVVNI
jgi:hypothetical protein